MTTAAAQLQFGAEFALFLVALAGLTFVLLRPELLTEKPLARLGVTYGFGALAGAAFLQGALLVAEPDSAVLVVLRVTGLLALIPLAFSWRAGLTSRVLLIASLVALALSEVLIQAGRPTPSDWARFFGAMLLGAALLGAGRRSIPTRIAASSAAILLAVVLAIALALSIVISDNVEAEAQRRFGADSTAETQQAGAQSVLALNNAGLIARVLANNSGTAAAIVVLNTPNTSQGQRDQAIADLTSAVQKLVADVSTQGQDPRIGPALVVDPNGGVLVASGVSSNADAALLAGSPAVNQALRSGNPRQSIVIAGSRVFGVGVRPITLNDAAVSGAVIVTTQLDDTYLQSRVTLAHSDIPGYGIALSDRSALLAVTGPQPSTNVLLAQTNRVLGGVENATTTSDNRFVVSRPLFAADDSRLASLSVSVPAEFIAQTREDVFRALFVAALATALLALVLAAAVGESIGAGLRRLTLAAGALQAGDLHASAGLVSDDELGVLSSSFDSMTGSIRGMTADLRQAAEDEAELRARLEAVVAGMAEALVAVDDEGNITDFNAAAEQLCNIPSTRAIGRPVDQVVQVVESDGAELLARLHEPVLESWTEAATVKTKNGEVPVVVSAGTLRGAANQVVGAVFLLRDVRREQEVERMKTEFLANISHEMRSPLTPIKGYAGMLRTRKVNTDKVKVFASEIEYGVNQLQRVVDQLVNFATIAAGRLELHAEEVKVREVLDHLVDRWRERVGPDLTIQRRIARGVSTLTVDRHYLDQSLDELVDNAVKYSPDSARVLVSAAVVDVDGTKMVEIAVTDHGEGIPPDRLDTIFDEFSQGDASATRRFGGLGLGLALVSRIVRAHGGDLDVTSVLGKGTRAAIRLPVDAGGST